MTEDEAKQRWCPFARKASLGTSREAVNRKRDGSPADHSGCIASACMAWRWVDDWETSHTPPDPMTDDWMRAEAVAGVAHWVRRVRRSLGYCGLAGAPQ